MIDRRRLMAMGLGAGVGLAGPVAALAATHRPSHHASGHGAAHHGKDHHGLQLIGRRGRHPTGPVLHHDRIYPEMEHISFGPRSITLENIHTDEKLDAIYWDKGAYVPDALEAVNKVLRDFRTGDVYPIDPRLLDTISEVRSRIGSKAPFQVISGYGAAQLPHGRQGDRHRARGRRARAYPRGGPEPRPRRRRLLSGPFRASGRWSRAPVARDLSPEGLHFHG
jgi:hypothetical protein